MPMKPVFRTVKIFVVVAIVKIAFEAGMVVVPIIIAFVVLVRRSIPVPVAVVKFRKAIVEDPEREIAVPVALVNVIPCRADIPAVTWRGVFAPDKVS